MELRSFSALRRIIAFVLLVAPGAAWGACLRDELEAVVDRFWNDCKIYAEEMCFYNSGELARKVSEVLGEAVKPQDLALVLVKNKGLNTIFKYAYEVRTKHMLHSRNVRPGEAAPQDGSYRLWKYHVVLVYKGLVLDLDRVGPDRVQPAASYFKNSFAETDYSGARLSNHLEDKDPRTLHRLNKPEDLQVVVISADRYFEQFPNERPTEIKKGDFDFIESFPEMPLNYYIHLLQEMEAKKP